MERDAGAAFKASIGALDKSYLGALDRSLTAATSGGKLEDAVALRAEKRRIEKGEGVPSEIDESTATAQVPDTLKILRKTYRSTVALHEATKAKAMQPLYDKYDQALAAAQTELTQAQKLDDALRVKAVREQIAATRGGAEGGAGTSARNATTGGEAAKMNEADKSVRAPLNATSLFNSTIDKPFTNSLGMKFVQVPGTQVLFCIHETRIGDYAKYAGEVPGVDEKWKSVFKNSIPAEQRDNHPVLAVNYDDAHLFCAWLSKKEGRTYRLPSDEEWSNAVGIGKKEKRTKNSTPQSLTNQVRDEYPWGGTYPPKTGDLAGNYSDTTARAQNPDANIVAGYSDGFSGTAPVMSFKPKTLGIYDMGGNAFEWCLDWWNAEQKERTVRGGCYSLARDGDLLSACRVQSGAATRGTNTGFRIVLETAK